MTSFQAFTQGFRRVSHSKRLIFFVWFVNFAFALLLALPLRNQLESYVGPTVNEEKLLQKWDQNWYGSFKADFEKSQTVQMFNYSVLGYAPFVTNLDGAVSGRAVQTLWRFFTGLLTKFDFSAVGMLSLLLLLYTLLGTYFAGGFISAYSEETTLSLKEFLSQGAVYFGRFFRLFILSTILYALFFWLMGTINDAISSGTANSPSEMTPFIWYMLRNIFAFFLLAVIIMWFDYAKIRLVVDNRWSALGAFGTGVKFTFSNFAKSFPLVVLLTAAGVVLMALYGILEHVIPQSGYWTVLIVFVLAQVYMFFRIWLKATFFGSQTALFQGLSAEQHAALVDASTASA